MGFLKNAAVAVWQAVKITFLAICDALKKIRSKVNGAGKIYTAVSNILYLALFSFFVIVMTQFMMFVGVRSMLDWIEKNDTAFLIGVLLVACIYAFVYLFSFSHVITSSVLYVLVIVMSFVNYSKLEYRNEVFQFVDLIQIKEAVSISAHISLSWWMLPANALIGLALFTAALFFVKPVKPKFTVRTVAAVAAVPFFLSSMNLVVIADDSLWSRNLTGSIFNIRSEYYENGFLLSFANTVKSSMLKKPVGYSKQNVEKALDKLSPDGLDTVFTDDGAALSNEEKPNVIYIMYEAFSDLNGLLDIEFSENPFDKLDIPGVSKATTIAPVLGGNTCNSEFEALTGATVTAYNNGAVIYQQFLKNKLWSVPYHFKTLGYSTTGVHPYYGWFFRRNTVYPLLSIEKYITRDEMTHRNRMRTFLSDDSFVLDIYDANTTDEVQPNFTFGVSMQNHGSYALSRYKEEEIQITVTSDELDEAQVGAMTDYINGINYSVESYLKLIDLYKYSSKPTYIVMFGDHRPSFKSRLDLTEAMHDDSKTDFENDLELHKTPAYFWTNTSNEQRDFGTFSTFYLGVHLFKFAGMELPEWYQILENVEKQLPVVTFDYVGDENGNLYADGTYKSDVVDSLRLLTYDMTFGKNYSKLGVK